MAIKHKVKTAAFGTDFLGLFYKRIPFEERKFYLREIANRGAGFVRIFNCDKDNMRFEDYNDEYWAELERSLKLCYYEFNNRIIMIIPILSLGGYWRMNKKKLTQEQWEWVFGKAIDVLWKVFPKGNFMVEIVNEPFTYTPAGWKRTEPRTMHNKMYDIGLWHAHMVKLCMNKGLKIGQTMVNVIDVPDKDSSQIRNNIYYPRNAKTADMILGKIGELKHRRDVIASYHRIHFPEDIKSDYGAGRIFATQISRFWHFTNDGDSAISKKGNGVDPNPLLNGVFKTIDKKELADISYQSFILARDGIKHGRRTHKMMIWYADLGRDDFVWDVTWYCKKCNYKFRMKGLSPNIARPKIPKCPDCGAKIYHRFRLTSNMDTVDYERIDVMERQYFKIFGKHSKNYGKFLEPKKEEIKPIPEPETEEGQEEKKEEEKMSGLRAELNEIWSKIFRVRRRPNFKLFWNESMIEQKIIGIEGVIVLGFILGKLLRIF